MPSSQTSPSRTRAYASVSEARPPRNDFTSSPVSTMPHSIDSRIW